MTKKEIESANSEAIENSGIPPDNAIKDRKNFLTAKRLENVVAILLGITTLLSAWTALIGSLHGGIQSIWMEDNNQDNPFKTPSMTEKYFDSAHSKICRIR